MAKFNIDYNGLRLIEQALEADKKEYESDKPRMYPDVLRYETALTDWMLTKSRNTLTREQALFRVNCLKELFYTLED